MIEFKDLGTDYCALCGEDIEDFEGFDFASDEDGRVWVVHADREMCKEILEVKDAS